MHTTYIHTNYCVTQFKNYNLFFMINLNLKQHKITIKMNYKITVHKHTKI